MTKVRPASLAAALAAGALALTGCGSTPLSLAQLRTRATSICERANRQLEAIGAPQAASGAKPFLEKGAAVLSRELHQLSALTGSGDEGEVYRAALLAAGAELAAIRSTTQRLDRGADTVPALQALSRRLSPLEVQADEAWRALRIPACLTR